MTAVFSTFQADMDIEGWVEHGLACHRKEKA